MSSKKIEKLAGKKVSKYTRTLVSKPVTKYVSK